MSEESYILLIHRNIGFHCFDELLLVILFRRGSFVRWSPGDSQASSARAEGTGPKSTVFQRFKIRCWLVARNILDTGIGEVSVLDEGMIC